jgi:hypothetical protein
MQEELPYVRIEEGEFCNPSMDLFGSVPVRQYLSPSPEVEPEYHSSTHLSDSVGENENDDVTHVRLF